MKYTGLIIGDGQYLLILSSNESKRCKALPIIRTSAIWENRKIVSVGLPLLLAVLAIPAAYSGIALLAGLECRRPFPSLPGLGSDSLTSYVI